MNYPESLAWLYGTQERGIKLGLDRVREFLAMLGYAPGTTRYVHVAGTNGKGSVCAMVDAMCRAGGLRTGLFTSPHLVEFRERIRVDGVRASEEEIARELTRIREICEAAGALPTFFEITTALALGIFRQADVDVAVLEVGLGGRLDSTNVVTPVVAVITSIGMDHMQYLGGTIEEIAGEKAGIIKPGVPVVTGVLPKAAAEVVARVAAERGARLVVVDWEASGEIGLNGTHQRGNAAVALEALRHGGINVGAEAEVAGLRGVHWPGRFQDTHTGFILDGAHNPDAARRLVETWREVYGRAKTEVIVGAAADKDARGICAELAGIAARFIVVPVPGPRGGPVTRLAEVAREFAPVQVCGSLEEGVEAVARGEIPALITGSLFLIGEALSVLGLTDQEREESAQ